MSKSTSLPWDIFNSLYQYSMLEYSCDQKYMKTIIFFKSITLPSSQVFFPIDILLLHIILLHIQDTYSFVFIIFLWYFFRHNISFGSISLRLLLAKHWHTNTARYIRHLFHTLSLHTAVERPIKRGSGRATKLFCVAK